MKKYKVLKSFWDAISDRPTQKDSVIDLHNGGYADWLLEEGYIEEIKEKELPKSWEELGGVHGYYISTDSELEMGVVSDINNQNTFATKNQARSALAMAQLSQLMKVYNDGWVPDWSDNESKYVINYFDHYIDRDYVLHSASFLAFKTEALCTLFLENFPDLIKEYFLMYK